MRCACGAGAASPLTATTSSPPPSVPRPLFCNNHAARRIPGKVIPHRPTSRRGGKGARGSAKTASFGLVVGHMPIFVPGDVLPVPIRASMCFLPCFQIRRRGVMPDAQRTGHTLRPLPARPRAAKAFPHDRAPFARTCPRYGRPRDAAAGGKGARQQGSRSHVRDEKLFCSPSKRSIPQDRHHKDLSAPRYPAGARAGAAPD